MVAGTLTGPSIGAQLAADAIRAYQRWISPYKGFSCAYRVLHGGRSCSAFGKRLVMRSGVTKAIATMRSRFAACRAAAQTLRKRRILDYASRKPQEQRRQQAQSRWRDSCDPGSAACDCGPDIGCDFAGDAACAAADGCDCSPL